jgi:transposase
MPSVALVWADGGYAGQLVRWAKRLLKVTVEIVRKPLGIPTFQVLPRRWVVERTFAWIVRCRRLDHDYERLPEHSEAMIKWAMIGLMTHVAAVVGTTRPRLRLVQHRCTGPRFDPVAEDRDGLGRYFAQRDADGKTLRLPSFRFNGNTANYGDFQYTLIRGAEDLAPTACIGKGAAVCDRTLRTLGVWSVAKDPRRQRTP